MINQTVFFIENNFAFAIEQDLADTYENRILALKDLLVNLGLDTDLKFPEDILRDENQFKYQLTLVYQICRTMNKLSEISISVREIVEQYLGRESYRYIADFTEVDDFDREKQTYVMLPEIRENTEPWNSKVDLKTYLEKVFVYIPSQFKEAKNERSVVQVLESIQPNVEYLENHTH